MQKFVESFRHFGEKSLLYKETLKKLSLDFTYELVPLLKAENNARALISSLPTGTKIAISTSPKLGGLERTLELTEEAEALGLDVCPHITARSIKDETDLCKIGEKIKKIGKAVIISGDNPDPIGIYESSLQIIKRLAELDLLPGTIYISGYPDGHKKKTEKVLMFELKEKQKIIKAYNSNHLENKVNVNIITQMSLSPEKILKFIKKIRSKEIGIDLPVIVGLPGTTNKERLFKFFQEFVSEESASMLMDNKKLVLTMGLMAIFGFNPMLIVDGLVSRIAKQKDNLGVVGLRAYTFNDLESSNNLLEGIQNQIR